METGKILIKTDRNGTKYYRVKDICPRCGGRGEYIRGINFGVCFLCHGTGVKEYTVKEYTPEHAAKLEARRKSKAAEQAEAAKLRTTEHEDEFIARRYAEFGCGKDGIGYALTGKTYAVKDEIKRNGGKWIYGAWVCPIRIDREGIEARQINLKGHIGAGSETWLDDFDLYDAIHG